MRKALNMKETKTSWKSEFGGNRHNVERINTSRERKENLQP